MMIRITLILMLYLFSCTDDKDPETVDLPAEYTYVVSISCFCPTSYRGPHRLHIRNNDVIDYQLLDTDNVVADSSLIPSLTIESLITKMNTYVAQNPVKQEIELHPKYHFPVKTYFDISELLADEEWGFEISEFKVIKD